MSVYKIAIIGSPCCGKTSIIEELKTKYETVSPNIRVIYIPEVATCFLSGLSKPDPFIFQYYVAKTQVLLEDTVSAVNDTEDIILICDRGIFDAYVYQEKDDADNILSKIGEIKDYSLIFYLESLPKELFELKKANNPSRKETVYSDVVNLGEKTLEVWRTNSHAEIKEIKVKMNLGDRADALVFEINRFFEKEVLKRKI